MALSKEFYLDEIRSKYPNSYNEGLKDLPVKDLEDMPPMVLSLDLKLQMLLSSMIHL